MALVGEHLTAAPMNRAMTIRCPLDLSAAAAVPLDRGRVPAPPEEVDG